MSLAPRSVNTSKNDENMEIKEIIWILFIASCYHRICFTAKSKQTKVKVKPQTQTEKTFNFAAREYPVWNLKNNRYAIYSCEFLCLDYINDWEFLEIFCWRFYEPGTFTLSKFFLTMKLIVMKLTVYDDVWNIWMMEERAARPNFINKQKIMKT